MPVIELSRIQVRRGQENQTGVPTLAGGEFGWAADTEHLYIGLRREDGGSRDANVRILTENDLFDSVGADTSVYVYRDGSNITSESGDFITPEVSRTVLEKLDDIVSVKDFGEVGVGGISRDSAVLQRAIDRLFLTTSTFAPSEGISSAKILLFPTGIYNIDENLRLPPYTTIIGEGIGKTIINLTSTATHAFITVDGEFDLGNPSTDNGYRTFDSADKIQSGITQPNYIRIEGMTVQYDSTLTTFMAKSLLSLDCSENAVIRNVKFAGTAITGYNGTVNAGYSGIDIRGFGGLQASSENVLIDNCVFDGLYHCVKSNYDIVNPIIQNSKFYRSIRGISFNDPYYGVGGSGPAHGRFLNNRFEEIHQQAIYVGVNAATTGTNHISMNNQFYNVGNLGGGRESTTGTAIVTYLTDGNLSVNDFFDRQEWQNQNLNLATTYYPLVEGRAALDSVGVNTSVLFALSNTPIIRFPTTGYAQRLSISYTIFQPALAPVPVDPWDSLTTYNIGAAVSYLDDAFSSIVDNNINQSPFIDIGGVLVLNTLYWEYLFNNTVAVDRVGTVEFYIPATNARISGSDLIVSDNYNYSGDGDINFNIAWNITLDVGNTYYQISVYHASIYDLTIEYQTKLMI